MAKRYLIGGPSNSGKSTFILSVAEALKGAGLEAASIELDVWSNSYPAFRGEVTFEARPKRFDANPRDLWWREALAPRIADYLREDRDIAFGDLPGVLGAANSWTCERVWEKTDGAIVVAKDERGIKEWKRFFESDFRLPVIAALLSIPKSVENVLPDMDRRVDPENPFVRWFGEMLARGGSDRPE